MRELLSVAEARRTVLAAVTWVQPVEHVPLADALGRTLAEPVVSRDAIPPFDNSAMDGFAVRTADFDGGTATLRVIGEAAAGRMPDVVVEPGTCVRIMTGAPIPAGADAVAPVEWTEPDGDRVLIGRAPTAGQYVRPAGQDVQPGDTMAKTGTVVTPPVVGMAATLGFAELAVRVPPRVAVVATGDELVPAGAALRAGHVRDANGPALAAQVVAAGGTVVGPLHARDDADDARRVLGVALDADVVVVSGGVSMGEYDVVRDVLDALGVTWAFWRVRQRPGKPLAFGTRPRGRGGDTLVFGLPGNPVSSAVCFEQYVRPALAALLGRSATVRTVPAVLAEDVAKQAGLHHFVRGLAEHDADGRLRVRPTGAQASNLYSSVLRADVLIHLPEAIEDPAVGTPVEVEWLRW
ncbi:MAG: gephyrin-like molybdotransferase Glp [Rhodothermales bacterium]